MKLVLTYNLKKLKRYIQESLLSANISAKILKIKAAFKNQTINKDLKRIFGWMQEEKLRNRFLTFRNLFA
jgi:hypothetical protein